MDDPKFLTVTEVAALMRVSRMTVYRLVDSGALASVRVSRGFRVREAAVNDYLSGVAVNGVIGDRWDDLRFRMEQAAATLEDRALAVTESSLSLEEQADEVNRLAAKRSGVLLCLDYMRGYGD